MEYCQDENTKKAEAWLQNFLKKVELMPTGKERWAWVKDQKEYEEFCTLFLEHVYKKKLSNLYDGDGMASFEKKYSKKIDSIAFMEALVELVSEYRFTEEFTIFQKFRQKLKQKYNRERNINGLNENMKGMIPPKERSLIIAYSKYRQYKARYGNDFANMEMLHDAFRESVKNGKFSEKSILNAMELVDSSFFHVPITGQDGEEIDPLEDVTYSLETEEYQSPEASILKQGIKTEIEEQMDFFVKAYQIQADLFGVKKMEFIRTFYTRTILTVLKLESGKDGNGKEELKCPNSHRYTVLPAGTEEIYHLLAKQENFYMNTVFHMPYIEKAVEKKPESLDTLYGIYYNFLEEGFKFTDDVIGEVLQESKQKVSRYRKKYEEFLNRLQQMKKENGWE